MGCKWCKIRRANRVAPILTSSVTVETTEPTARVSRRRLDTSIRPQAPPTGHSKFITDPLNAPVPREGGFEDATVASPCKEFTDTSNEQASGYHSFAVDKNCREDEKAVRKTVSELLTSWKKSGIVEEIENTVSTIEESSIQILTKRLLSKQAKYVARFKGKPSFQLQLAKAYAIFSWIANHIKYDFGCIDALESGELTSEAVSPENVLSTGATICSGYAKLFVALAERAGLVVKYISGHVKSLKSSQLHSTTYQAFSPEQSNSHAWNMVQILGVWFPVDCTFGAGHEDTENLCVFIREFNPLYFAAPPEQLIFTHIPNDEHWQLLENPHTLESIKHRIAPNIHYFKFGIQAEEDDEYIELGEDNSQSVVHLKFRTCEDVGLMVKLLPTGLGKHSDLNSDGRLTFLEYYSNGCITVKIVLPNKGLFCAEVFGCNRSEQKESNDWTYTRFLSYFIDNFRASSDSAMAGYPVVNPISASKVEFRLLRWKVSAEEHVAVSNTGEADLEFQLHKNVKVQPTLTHSSGRSLYHYTSLQQVSAVNNMSQYTLKVVFPEKGHWTITLFEVESRNVLMKYHVHCSKPLFGYSYPKISSDIIQLPHYKTPALIKGVLSVPFRTTKTLFFKGFIGLHSRADYNDITYDQAYVSKEGVRKYQLNVVLPHVGMWEVGVLLGDPIADGEISLSEAFSILTEVVTESECCPQSVYPQLKRAASNFRIKIPKTPVTSKLSAQVPISIKVFTPSNLIFNHHIELAENSTALDKCTFLLLSDDAAVPSVLKAVFPEPGQWIVKLFAEVDCKKALKEVLSLCVEVVDSPYTNFCGYPEILPIAAQQADFRLLDWSSSQSDHIAETSTGTLKVSFTTKQGVELNHFIVRGKDEQNTIERIDDSSTLNPPILQLSKCQKQFLTVVFPDKGYWTVYLLEEKSFLMKYTVLYPNTL